MRKLLFGAVILLCGMLIQAQNTISGIITDSYKNPLSDVHVELNKMEEFSDLNGKFTFENILVGNHRIQIDFPGYSKIDTIILVNGNVELKFNLKEEIYQLKEAKIEHAVSFDKTVASHSLNKSTIDQYNGKSLGDVLQEIEGVSALKTGNSIVKPIVNGLHSSRVPIITNFTRLEDQEWGTEHAPNIDLNSASDIQVIKGANALQFGGDAVGGIILINSANIARKDTLYGKTILTVNYNGRGGALSTSLTKGYASGWFWDTTISGKLMGDLEAPDYILSNTGSRTQSAFFQGGLKKEKFGIWGNYSLNLSQNGILKAAHIGNLNDLVNAINSHQPYYISKFTYDLDHPKQEVMHHLIQLNAYSKFFGIGKFDFRYAFQFNNRKEFDIRRGSYSNTPALDLDLVTNSGNFDFESEKFGNWKFKTGLSIMYQVNKPNPFTNVRPLIPDYKQLNIGAYFITEYSPSPKLTLNLGGRYDYENLNAKKYYLKSRWEERGYDELFPEFVIGESNNQILANPVYDFHNFSASFGLNFHPSHEYDFFTNFSFITRNPNPSELFSDGLHHSIATIELGDLKLNQEKAFKFSLTTTHKSDNLNWDISPYINYINNFIQLVPSGLEYTIRGAFPVWNYTQNEALLWGIDASVDWNYTTSLSHKITAAYIYGQNLEDDDPLIDMPPFNFSNLVGFRVERWNDLELFLKNTTYLTQSRYPDYNFTANLNVNGQTIPTLVDISTPPKGFSIFDFTAKMNLSPLLKLDKTRFEIGFSVENIFNTTYKNYLNHLRFYSDEVGRNFSLNLKINY